MNEAEIFVLSEKALTQVIDQITDEQWTMKVPTSIQKDGGTLKTLINYHAYDDAWVPDTLAGKTISEVGDKYDGDLLGDGPKASWHAIVDKAVTAAEQVTNFDKIVHLSYGDFSTKEYLWHISTFRTFRAVDIARLIGVDDTLSPELVQGMWDILVPQADMLRKMGVFEAEVGVSEDAPLQERLLGLSGRQPKR